MSGIKISELPQATTLTGRELIPIVQNSCTKYVEMSAVCSDGDITSVTAQGGLAGGGTSGDVCLSIDNNCLTKWNGTNATVAATSGTWDEAYTTIQSGSGNWDQSACAGLLCIGDITAVNVGTGLAGGGTSGSVAICVDTACNTAWSGTYSTVQANSATWAVGGTDNVGLSSMCFNSGLSGQVTDGHVDIGIDSGTLTTYDQSACPGLNCIGTLCGTGTISTIPLFCSTTGVAGSKITQTGTTQINVHVPLSAETIRSMDVCCNICIGDNALSNADQSLGGAYANVAIGLNANCNAPCGNWNVAVGGNSMRSNVDGNFNTAIGGEAMNQAMSADGNTAIGYRALRDNYGGCYNTGIGYDAGCEMSEGCHNVAIGCQALRLNTTADGNIAIGLQAVACNLTGEYNVGIGHSAAKFVTTDCNVAIGYAAGQCTTSGDDNISIGTSAGACHNVGSQNIKIGRWAGYCNDQGSNNIILGACTMASHLSGSNNIAIGCGANLASTTDSDSVVIGKGAVGKGPNTIILGSASTTGSYMCGALYLDLADLPTSDPGSNGQVWVDGNTLRVSLST